MNTHLTTAQPPPCLDPNLAGPATASGGSMVGRGDETPAADNVSWMVLYEAALTKFYQSTTKLVSVDLQELCNYHQTLKTIMGYTQTLDSGAEFEDFNGEDSMTPPAPPPLPVYPLLILCVCVTALLQATGNPRASDPDDLHTFPSRYLERIPQIIEWISRGEREWIAQYTDNQASVDDIHTWASELKDGLTRFDGVAREFAEKLQTDIQTTRLSLAKDLSNHHREGYSRLKRTIRKIIQRDEYESNSEMPSASQHPPR